MVSCSCVLFNITVSEAEFPTQLQGGRSEQRVINGVLHRRVHGSSLCVLEGGRILPIPCGLTAANHSPGANRRRSRHATVATAQAFAIRYAPLCCHPKVELFWLSMDS